MFKQLWRDPDSGGLPVLPPAVSLKMFVPHCRNSEKMVPWAFTSASACACRCSCRHLLALNFRVQSTFKIASTKQVSFPAHLLFPRKNSAIFDYRKQVCTCLHSAAGRGQGEQRAQLRGSREPLSVPSKPFIPHPQIEGALKLLGLPPFSLNLCTDKRAALLGSLQVQRARS